MENYFEIGKIIRPFGIKGELKVFPLTFDLNRFSLLDEVRVVSPKTGEATYHIERSFVHKNIVVLKFKEISTCNEAELLRNSFITIPQDKALPLDEDEYYIRDLLGIDVFTTDGENLGKLDEVIETGANDVYRIGNLLIPAIKQCIVQVDIKQAKMIVKLLEGLR